MTGAPTPTMEQMIQTCLDAGCRSIVLTRVGSGWQASVNVDGSNGFRCETGEDPIGSLKMALGFRDVVMAERRAKASTSVLSDIEDLL